MPTPLCQLNLTLDIPVAQEIERISREAYKRESGVGRILLEQRLSLEKAGWKCEDKDLAEVLETVVSLNEKGRKKVAGFLADLLKGDEKVRPASTDYLVKDSYFQSSAFPFKK